MKAAVVTAFDQPPRYQDHPEPSPGSPTEVVVDVLAAGLHPRVRSQADGSHYTSHGDDEGALPLVPGIDGVGRTPDGSLRYFVLPDTTLGSMAERTLVDVRRSVELPADADPVRIAAAMNPAMSSWLALRRRVELPPGATVLVFPATGNAGRLAVPIAKALGAGSVVAAGRGDAARLASLHDLGADVVVDLTDTDALGAAAAEVDVVLDYVWGQPTADALRAIVPRRTDDGRPLTWVQIGSVAGAECPVPSAALRACRLQIVGSGQGSIPTRDIVAELGDLAAELTRGDYGVDARAVPLADVTQAWADAVTTAQRIVLVP